MNQSILFNDNLRYILLKKCWYWSAILGGDKIEIVVESAITPETFTTNTQFDWELTIEEWLAEHELEDNQLIISID